MNGGTCVDGPSQFRCLCQAMFYGVYCEHFLPQASTPAASSLDCSLHDCQEKAGNGQCDVRVVTVPIYRVDHEKLHH